MTNTPLSGGDEPAVCGLCGGPALCPPLQLSRQNLLREGKRDETIVVTGNTAIDALKTTVREDYRDEILDWAGIPACWCSPRTAGKT